MLPATLAGFAIGLMLAALYVERRWRHGGRRRLTNPEARRLLAITGYTLVALALMWAATAGQ